MNWLYDVIDRILINTRKKKYVKDDYFRIADEYTGLLPIEILKGPYKGTIYTVNCEVIDDYGKATFDHTIIKKIPGKHDSYHGDTFTTMAKEIMLVCIEEAQQNYHTIRQEVLKDDDTEPDYSEEFTETRAVSTKGTSSPKE
jgi:hypothetical protein